MLFSSLVFCLLRLNSSLVSLVAISANPAAEGTTSMLSNGAQRTVAPTIVKPIHNGTTMSLVNVTPAEPATLSKFLCFPPFILTKSTTQSHPRARVSIHPISPSSMFPSIFYSFRFLLGSFSFVVYCYAYEMLCCFCFDHFTPASPLPSLLHLLPFSN